MSTIQLVPPMAAHFGWKVHQMNLKSASLNKDLEEVVYMYQPEGFQVSGKEQFVCKLKKALYGLKQAPRAWYIKIDRYLVERGFWWSPSYASLYAKSSGTDIILLVIYVDDIIIIGSEASMNEQIKSNMSKAFDND